MSEKKFAVIIRTYRRKNGSSFNNLLRVVNFLNNQTYKNFKVFLIGDDYDDQEEFDKIVSMFPEDKIYSYNNNVSFRKGYFKIKKNKWCTGGMLANLIGLRQAIKEKFKYYVHLDDDDIWLNNHLETVNEVVDKFPKVGFIVSYSKYKNIHLPREFIGKKNIKIFYDNFKPRGANSVHSSWIVNLEYLGDTFLKIYEERLGKINMIKDGKIKEFEFKETDRTLLDKINNLQKNKKVKCIFIPKCTVEKKTDGNIPE